MAPESTSAPAGTGTTTTATGSEATCEQAISHAMSIMTAAQPNAPADQVKQIHDILARHCQSDAWSGEVRACFVTMKTVEDGDACANKMTPTQQSSLNNEKLPGDDEPPANAPAMGGAPPPAAPAGTTPPPPPGGTRGPVNKSGDPCDGGN